jgi:uncharacterized membrane protein
MPSIRPVSRRTRALAAASAALCVLAAAAVVVTGSRGPAVLVWNLFLAWIPYGLGRSIVRLARGSRHGTGLLVLPTALWLLFLPNAPYVVTDLVHVARFPPPLWLPAALFISAFALVALVLGLATLFDVHRVVRRRLGHRWGAAFAATVCLLCGLGVWMGRVLRWNSWDALHSPFRVVQATLERLVAGPGGPVFVLAFGALLHALYARTAGRSLRAAARPPEPSDAAR